MDGVTLDRLLAELRPLVVGRRLGRPRGCGRDAVGFEAGRDQLRLDAGRGRAGLYLLGRPAARRLEAGDPSPATRQALLHIRKHAGGRLLRGLDRVPGERTVVLDLDGCLLVLRLSGASPALTLVVEGTALATAGDGPPAWPLPPPQPGREWDTVPAAEVEAAARRAEDSGRRKERGVAAACPSLGPVLAREVDGTAAGFEALRLRLRHPRPTVVAPARPESWTDALLAAGPGALIAPVPLLLAPGVAIHPEAWTEAAALFLEARVRAERFAVAHSRLLGLAAAEVRRLSRLEQRLVDDRRGLQDPAALRRQAEALLAALPEVEKGATEVAVADPYQPGERLRVGLDPALGVAGNADRLFARARRIERALEQIEVRIAQTRRALVEARERESSVSAASDMAELEGGREVAAPRLREDDSAGPRHYLTGRGLSVLVGRGARENHRLTFALARPEDLWLHVLDGPGAHVILCDPEGRAVDADIREAAEVAAWFSSSHGEGSVDVRVTRRKHLRPGRGGPGRVQVGHAETVRVAPRDPEGRLRRRDSRRL